MKLTDEQIITAATEAAKIYGPDENSHRHAFQAGYEKALSQMQPIPTSQRTPTIEDSKDKFKCYEIWRPNIPADGCKEQCKECREQQASIEQQKTEES